jgi:hypothetical protein
MVLLMHFNNNPTIGENATYAVDESGSVNNGTITGSASWTSQGKFGGAITMPDVNSYVDFSTNNFPTGSQPFTVSAWFKVYALDPGEIQYVFCYGTQSDAHGYMLGAYNGQSISGGWWNLGHDVTVSYSTDTWYHIAETYDGTNARLYFNGVLKDTAALAGNTMPGSMHHVGERLGYGGGGFRGTVDEVTVYNRSLSPEEIADYYNYRRGFYQSNVYDAGANASWQNLTWSEAAPYGEELNPDVNTIGLWHLNEASWSGASREVRDSAGAHHGTALGGANTIAGGKFGRAGRFDGSSGWVQVPHASSLVNPSFTVTAWANINGSADSEQLAAGKAASYYLKANHPGQGAALQVLCQPDEWTHFPGPSIRNGGWSFLAGTFDGTSHAIKLYLNGVLVNGGSCSNALRDDGQPFSIGGVSGAWLLNGSADEVALYDRQLSADEILSLYKRGVLNLKLQACSKAALANCTAGEFKGPDGTSGTFFTNATFSNLAGVIGNNRYFQWKAVLETEDANYTPWVYNVTAAYLAP